MATTMMSLTPVCMILFKDEEEPRLRRWLADHGYVYRNASTTTNASTTNNPSNPTAEPAEANPTPQPDPDKPLPLNRINSLFIWNDFDQLSFTGTSLHATALYANAYPDRVFKAEEFLEHMEE